MWDLWNRHRRVFYTAGRPERSLQANMTLQKLLEANVGLLETTLTTREAGYNTGR